MHGTLNKLLRYIFCASLLLLLAPSSASAASCLWIAAGGDGNWNNTLNWSGAGCTSPSSVPESTDDVYFDPNQGGSAGNITIDVNVDVNSITITDIPSLLTFTQNSGVTIRTRAGFSQNNAIFSSSAAGIDIDGTFTLSGGTFIASSGNTNIGGNFVHSGGTFTANGGTVILDGGNQTLSGTTTFYKLTKNVTSAYTLTFPASTTTTITNTMNLQGASGNLLSLRSSSTGTQASINPQSTRTIAYLDVKDNNNVNATAIDATSANTTDSGNNTNWTFSSGSSTPEFPDIAFMFIILAGSWYAMQTMKRLEVRA